MKLNKLLLILCSCFLFINMNAKDLTGVRIYINPGHGGYDGANDRNVETIPYALNDTLGFWESSSNLTKGLALRDMLEANGAYVMISRTLNRDADDRSLSEIAEESSANNMDSFLSIHSNAVGVNSGTNYLLLLFRGTDTEPDPADGKPMATACWPRMYDNALTNWSHYTETNSNNRGDYSYYGYHLGVLRNNTTPGFLSEGQFHDYLPETHRLLNKDYRILESARFFRYFCDYFKADHSTKGILAGAVKSSNERISNILYRYKAGTNDQWLPINKATVELYTDAGTLINTYETDSCYNGVYVFYDLNPGNYKVKISAQNYESVEIDAIVKAGLTTSMVTQILNTETVREIPPNYPDPAQEAGVVVMPSYNTKEVAKNTAEWLNSKVIKRSIMHNNKVYILTTESKIYIADQTDLSLIKEMSIVGVEGGTILLSDIGFTSDGLLLACNKNEVKTIGTEKFKVYIWNNDDADPKVLISTNKQGGFNTSVIGETMAVSGASWKCRIYTSAVSPNEARQIRIAAYEVSDDDQLTYKYMKHNDYTEANWGEKIMFTTSPLGEDRFIVDSEKLLPTEFGFDWIAFDSSPLISYGSMAEGLLAAQAKGATFFKYANHSLMIAPDCKQDETQVGAVLFDVTDGLANAKILTEKMPEEGLGTSSSPYMMAATVVRGYDMDFYVYAQNQGYAKYTTITSDVVANIYASGLTLTETPGSGYEFSFILNEKATDVTIEFTDGEQVIGTYSAGALEKGTNKVSVSNDNIPTGRNMNWRVRASAPSVIKPVKLTGDDAQLQFYNTYGVAVDNNPESSYFGRVYVTSSLGGKVKDRTTDQGIYILDSNLNDVTGQGEKSYNGGITWNAKGSSPFRLTVAEDGRVFMSDWSDTNSGVYIMDPANPGNNFIKIFDGLTRDASGIGTNADGIAVHGSSSSCYVQGTGENTVLYTFDEDYKVNGKAGNILQYNIGTSTSWDKAPLIAFENAANKGYQINMNSTILPDGHGGWWISQYRAADAADVPSLIHFNGTKVDFVSGEDPLLLENSRQGGMAISIDGTKIAMGCNNEIKILGVEYAENGKPTVKKLHSIKPGLGSNSNGLAFDWAGNVYLVSNSNERLGKWALPKANNTAITPAHSSQLITKLLEGSVENLEAKADGNKIVLTWTAPKGSVGNPKYNVYKSDELIETVSELTYTDSGLETGTYNYAVSALYGDYETEKVTASATITTGIEEEIILATIYPNPTDGILNIEFNELINSIRVYNLSGHLLLDIKDVNKYNETIDITNFVKGTYLLKINEQSVKIIRK